MLLVSVYLLLVLLDTVQRSALHQPSVKHAETAQSTACEEEDDIEKIIIMQLRAEIESAMKTSGITPEPVIAQPPSGSCNRRRFVLNATDPKDCKNSSTKGLRCFAIPSQAFLTDGQRYILEVQKHADAFDVFTQRLSITEYFIKNDDAATEIEQEVELRNNHPKTGRFYIDLKGSTSSIDSEWNVHPTYVSVRCRSCATAGAIGHTAVLEIVDDDSSITLSRRRRDTKRINSATCQVRHRAVDLRKLYANIVEPDGIVMYSYCQGFCSSDSSHSHQLMHKFLGRVYACCTPTELLQMKVTMKHKNGNYSLVKLPIRVKDCHCL